jgi:hypothetical protein
MSEMKFYANEAARRVMARAFDLTDAVIESGDKDLKVEMCLCGYEGVATRPHYCPLLIIAPDEDEDA